MVPGSITSTGFTLRTYVYWIREQYYDGEKIVYVDLGLFPCSPTQATFAYAISGIPSITSDFYSSGFEPGDPTPLDKVVLDYGGVKNVSAHRCKYADERVPLREDGGGGEWCYKFTGYDDNDPAYTPHDPDSKYDGISFRIYDCDIPITRPTFLSFWIYCAAAPGGKDYVRISLQGYLTKDYLDEEPKCHDYPQIYQWHRYGRIIDQHGKATSPATYKVPKDGKWHRYVYSLYPAAEGKLKPRLTSLHISYENNPEEKDDKGWFTVYIDDIEISHEFPIKNCWYGEIFGNGGPNNENSDENFTLFFDSLTWEEPPCPPCEDKPLRGVDKGRKMGIIFEMIHKGIRGVPLLVGLRPFWIAVDLMDKSGFWGIVSYEDK